MELKQIKKMYGEKFMQICRSLFPTILEEEGKLLKILETYFAKNGKGLGEIIESQDLEEDLRAFVFSKIMHDKKEGEQELENNNTPYKLLEEQGYRLYECKSVEDIEKFKKYYSEDEMLCTFKYPESRLDNCVCYFAVKYNADEIKRGEYPKREDDYGTSVLAIQFNRQGYTTVSIKSRYNHTVNNPDSVFGNQLDMLAPGLESAFRKELLGKGIKLEEVLEEDIEIPGYIKDNTGKYYRYYKMFKGVYYCPGNIIIKDGKVKKLPNHSMIIENFILNIKDRTLTMFDEENAGYHDSFVDFFEESLKSAKIIVKKVKENGKKSKRIVIAIPGKNPVEIDLNDNNQILGYVNPNITELHNNFLEGATEIRKLEMENLTQMGDNCVRRNKLGSIQMPRLLVMGDNCFCVSNELRKADMNELRKMGARCFETSELLEELNMNNISEIKKKCFRQCNSLKKLDFNNIEMLGDECFSEGNSLEEVLMPKLKEIGNYCFSTCNNLTNIEMYNLVKMGQSCFRCINLIKDINFPNLITIGNECFNFVMGLRKIKMNMLQEMGQSCFRIVQSIEELIAPQLRKIGDWCFEGVDTKQMSEIDISKLIEMGNHCFSSNPIVEKDDRE